MKFHATDGKHLIRRRGLHFRSLCGRWMPDDERWAPIPTDVTCETCRRVLAARGVSA